jgi:tetratricopeptide (TPR) repeat protein
MFAFFSNPENHSRLIVLKIVVVLIVAGGLIGAGLKFYQPWRLDRLTREARAAAESGDFAEASLKVRRALQTAPNDATVCRLMAETLEKAQNPDAVSWCGRVAELSPGSTEALLRWARVALKFRKPVMAEKALAGVPEAERQSAEYQSLAGTTAFEMERFEEAARHQAVAVQREPNRPEHRLALASAQVRSVDLFARDSGRQTLKELADRPEFALPALRALVASYETSTESHAALRESHKLVETPGHSFLDELTRIRLLHNTRDERFLSALSALQEKSAKNPKNAGAIITWMGSVDLAQQAMDWATQREPRVGKMPEVRQAIAGCYLALKDWSTVLKVTQDGPWKQGDYIRHAYRSRALRGQGESRLASTEWNLAMSSAQESPDAIRWLSRIAEGSDWGDETEQALWAAIDNVADPMWAVGSLGRRFHEKKDTESLRRLAARYLTTEPKNENVRNDFAFLSLLLEKDTDRAMMTAHELYKKYPSNPAYVSTYAFALYRAGRFPEALSVLEALPVAELEKPAIATYYGVILSANRQGEKARKYLDLGSQAPLLPEEAALVTKATITGPNNTSEPR